tara:strand:+ start:1029 stop:1613 length:585 start_codon:yes stop_codon:yes gene_type:complete
MATSNISQNYTLTNYASGQERVGSNLVAASVIIRAVGTPSDGGTITLIDGLGNSKTYEFEGIGASDGVSAGNILVNASDNPGADTVFTRLKSAIEGASGHNGQILCSIDTSPGSFNGVSLACTLTLTQKIKGAVGNTAIAASLTNLYNDEMPTSFTGGVGSDNVPFRFSINGAPNIRNQTTSQHYETFVGEQRT